MEKYLQIIIPVLAMAVLTIAWIAVQLLAKKMKTKNHIDSACGCCGGCQEKENCEEKSELLLKKQRME